MTGIPREYRRAPRRPRVKSDAAIDWDLPGRGEVSNSGTCGRVRGLKTDGQRLIKGTHWFCGNPSCPECYPHWTTETDRPMQRIEAMSRHVRSAALLSDMRLAHIVISPDPRTASELIRTERGLDILYEGAYRVLWRAGVLGGLAVLHPWRGDDNVDRWAHLDPSEMDPRDIRAILEGSPSVWRLGPHLHVVGICNPEFVESLSASIYDETGWVVHVVEGADDLDVEGASRVLSYALSHAGIGIPRREGARRIRTVRVYGLAADLVAVADGVDHVPEAVVEKDYLSPVYDYDAIAAGMEPAEAATTKAKIWTVWTFKDLRPGVRAAVEGMEPSEVREWARLRALSGDLVYPVDPPDRIDYAPNVDLSDPSFISDLREGVFSEFLRTGPPERIEDWGVRPPGPSSAHAGETSDGSEPEGWTDCDDLPEFDAPEWVRSLGPLPDPDAIEGDWS